MVENRVIEAWAWEIPAAGGTWQTVVRAGWVKPSPDVKKFNLRPLYSESAAIECLREFVAAYRAIPDGELGKGLTNGHFLRAEKLLTSNA